MIHPKITEARESVKAKVTESHKKYVRQNHINNFKLVTVPEIVDEFMNIVVTMENEELRWNDWWVKGFKTVNSSCHHHGLLLLANEIAEEIYNEVSSVSSSI